MTRVTAIGQPYRASLIVFCVLSLVFALFVVGAAAPRDRLVYVVPLKGDIGPGMASFIKKAFRQAEGNGADAIILEIGTLGGFVKAALDIRDETVDLPIEVIAYVKGRAWSAGALVAIAADRIAMAPGSSMGAAEPRPKDAKTVSALRADFEATAEMRGRDPKVAAAMVDSDIEIPNLVEKGKLLTLSANKAKEVGYADTVSRTRTDVLKAFGYKGASMVVVKPTLADDVAKFLTGPMVAPVLMTIGLLGLVIEALTPGFGVPGTIGIASLLLYFASSIVAGVAGWGVVLFFILGLALLVIEALIPGFGIFGIAGLVSFALSIYSAASAGLAVLKPLIIAFIATGLIVAIFIRQVRKRGFPRGILLGHSLKTSEGYLASSPKDELIGKKGVGLTPLRPSGVCDMDGKRVDVVTEGEFLPRGSIVEVIKVEGLRVVVRAIPERDRQ